MSSLHLKTKTTWTQRINYEVTQLGLKGAKGFRLKIAGSRASIAIPQGYI